MKLFSPDLVLYLYKYIIQSCVECFFHVCFGTLSLYLEILDKLQKPIYRTHVP